MARSSSTSSSGWPTKSGPPRPELGLRPEPPRLADPVVLRDAFGYDAQLFRVALQVSGTPGWLLVHGAHAELPQRPLVGRPGACDCGEPRWLLGRCWGRGRPSVPRRSGRGSSFELGIFTKQRL